MYQLTIKEYNALVDHLHRIRDIYLPEISKRLSDSRKYPVLLCDSPEYELCRSEYFFMYDQEKKIEEVLKNCEVHDVVAFRKP